MDTPIILKDLIKQLCLHQSLNECNPRCSPKILAEKILFSPAKMQDSSTGNDPKFQLVNSQVFVEAL